MDEHEHTTGSGEPAERRGMTVFGRQGSPTVTLALPFSRVEVTADDAAPLVSDLADLTARLARVVESIGVQDEVAAEVAAIARAAEALSSAAIGPRNGR